MEWPQSPFTDAVGLTHPILQAPMAGAATPELAAAVSRAGGLGGLGLGLSGPDGVHRDIREARRRGATPLNANFFVHEPPVRSPDRERAAVRTLAALADELGVHDRPAPSVPFAPFDDDVLRAVVDERPEVVTFHFGTPPARAMSALHAASVLVGSSATTVAEARLVEQAGCDFVIAQGAEAGGHRGSFASPFDCSLIGTLALVPQVVDAVSVPVVAAGGISDGRGIVAAMALGASAVQVGTAFLRCPEADVDDIQRQLMAQGAPEDTTVTSAVSGRPARAFRNRLIDIVEAAGADARADYPVQFTVTGPLHIASERAGVTTALAMWAGQGFPLAREEPAGLVIDRLVRGAEAALRRVARPARGPSER